MFGLDTTFAKVTLSAAACLALWAPAAAGAATIEVDSGTDDGTGCTLREAIASADGNADAGGCTGSGTYGSDTVTFAEDVTDTIYLSSQLTINPTTSGTLHIAAPEENEIVLSGQDAHRVIDVTVNGGGTARAVTISGLTIRDGLVNEYFALGGGIQNRGWLTLDHVTVEDNEARYHMPPGHPIPEAVARGGGIHSSTRLTVVDSTIRNNVADALTSGTGFTDAYTQGGGIYARDQKTIVRRSTISGNNATATAASTTGDARSDGGGIIFFAGPVPDSNLIVENSTIVGNSTATSSSTGTDPTGGGIAARLAASSGPHVITSATIAGNTASIGANLSSTTTVTMQNTVLAEAIGAGSCDAGPISNGHNFSDDTSCGLTATGDQQGSPAGLQALFDVGGPTMVRRPTQGSPLIDKGVAAGLTTDQRGLERTAEYDVANASGGDGTDIGAVEIQGATPTATDPESPSTDTSSEVTGTTEPGTNVLLFGDATCATAIGLPVSHETFASPGVTATVGSNSSTSFRAKATYGASTSGCSPSGVTYLVPPPAPDLTGTSPASPGDDDTPTVIGTAASGTTVNLYTASDCTGAVAGTGSDSDLAGAGIEVSVPHNTSVTFYAQASGDGGSSPCSSSSVSYTTRPGAPVLTSTSPASPGDDDTPTVIGTANSGTTVNLYATADCTGDIAGTGSDSDLAGAGIEVSVPHNTSATFYAQATSANGTSPCSSTSVTYTTRPSTPVLTETDPASPANDNSPRLKGSADAGVTVNVYTAAACTGTIAGTGSAADLAGAGIEVSVADNSTTTFYAQATSANGDSPCSSGLSYTEATPRPDPGIVTPPVKPKQKQKCKKRKAKKGAAAAKKCKRKK